MPTFDLEFDCDNAAFDPDMMDEIVRILRNVADRLEQMGESAGGVWDSNGNRVGSWDLS